MKNQEETVSASRNKKSAQAEKPLSESATRKPKGKKLASETSAEPAMVTATAARKKKPAAKKTSGTKPATPKRKSPEIHISNEDIALRAYYIAERRGKMGWPGNSASDWLEAESQLLAEARATAKKSAK
jgi:hypothetical protein